MSNFPKHNFTQASSFLDLVHSGVCGHIVHLVGFNILLLFLKIFLGLQSFISCKVLKTPCTPQQNGIVEQKKCT
jgi:hypothetical protein